MNAFHTTPQSRAKAFPHEQKELRETVRFYSAQAAAEQNPQRRDNYLALRRAANEELRARYGVAIILTSPPCQHFAPKRGHA